MIEDAKKDNAAPGAPRHTAHFNSLRLKMLLTFVGLMRSEAADADFRVKLEAEGVWKE